MSHQWGRAADAGTWPRPKHLWTIGVLVAAVLSGAAVAVYRYTAIWTPLERIYLSAYIRSFVLADLGFPSGQYRVLHVTDRKGRRFAFDADVQPITTASGEHTVALSDVAVVAGVRRLAWVSEPYPHAPLHEYLRLAIYRGQTLADLLTPSLWAALGVGLVGLLMAIPRDVARARARRHGHRLKGPELVTPPAFNRRLRADGVGFALVPALVSRLFGYRASVRIPRILESSHILIMGDSGSGKSTLIRQMLSQLEARGDTAIVYDPALEYTPEFYNPARGDVILNPLDARCPYWSPGDELQDEAEALTLAKSLFPDRLNENPFFVDAPRRIFAHLLTKTPTAEQLTEWLSDDDALDRLVAGTHHASIIDRQAPNQRSGVLATLKMISDPLKLLPAPQDTTKTWSATAWAKKRQGWLFVTSTPETRTPLVPLTSFWLDLLVLRLMNQGQPGHRPVWFILDELASLQRLPQLHTAVTENRKSDNPVVLSFQGRSQLETRYGHDAEAMLSQPATKIFLRTSEPRAAEWISDSIGKIEIERVRESRSHGRDRQHTYGLERQVEPLVMASEIGGLANLRGYLKSGNLVVRLNIRFLQRVARAPRLIARVIRPLRNTLPPVAGPARTAPREPQAPDTLPERTPQHGTSEPGQELFFR